jgi:hypothetical protein
MSLPPEPKMVGRFNLYDTPDGGFHVSYQEDPTEENATPEVQHIDIPGAIVRASKMLGEGNMSPMKAMNVFMNLAKGEKDNGETKSRKSASRRN